MIGSIGMQRMQIFCQALLLHTGHMFELSSLEKWLGVNGTSIVENFATDFLCTF